MDEQRIQQLTEEVLAQLAGPKDPVTADLEARVVALERSRPAVAVVALVVHPSHHLLDVQGASSDGRCCLEPDRPCVQSGQCRALGH
jgi:hypothetical protein